LASQRLTERGSSVSSGNGLNKQEPIMFSFPVYICKGHQWTRYKIIQLWEQDNHMHLEYKRGSRQVTSDNSVKEAEMEMESKNQTIKKKKKHGFPTGRSFSTIVR
jgi:hypothetical protein